MFFNVFCQQLAAECTYPLSESSGTAVQQVCEIIWFRRGKVHDFWIELSQVLSKFMTFDLIDIEVYHIFIKFKWCFV